MFKEQFIYTSNPKEEIWRDFEYLESEKGALYLIENRLKLNFTGIEDKEYNYDNTIKKLNEYNNTENEEDKITIWNLLRNDKKEKKRAVKNICVLVKQAREFYKMADKVSLITKPILLYYGMLRLAKLLYYSTFKVQKPERSHGLEYKFKGKKTRLNDSAKISKKGDFPRFFNCFSHNIKIYLEEKEYSLLDLFKFIIQKDDLNPIINLRTEVIKYYAIEKNIEMKDFDMIKIFKSHFKIEKKEEILEDLASHYIAMFILASIARYYQKAWFDCINAKDSGEIYVIKRFIHASTEIFPNLILNRIWGKKFHYYNRTRSATDITLY